MAMASRYEKLRSGLPYLFSLLWSAATGRKIGVSYDVTDKCPLECDHCYQVTRRKPEEMAVDQAIEFVERMEKQGALLIECVGGEPTLRRNVLEAIAGKIPAMWVTTVGLTPLFHLPKTTWFISVDGATAEVHDRMRNKPGLFNQVLKNLRRFREEHKDPVFIHAVINKSNLHQVEQMAEFWKQNGLVDGIVFSVMTPLRNNILQQERSLSSAQRLDLIGRMLKLKSEFGIFLCMSKAMIRQWHPDVVAKWKPENCSTARLVYSANPLGQPIQQCIFGPQGDCSKCGCVVNLATETILKLSTVRELAKLYNPWP